MRTKFDSNQREGIAYNMQEECSLGENDHEQHSSRVIGKEGRRTAK